MTSRRRNWLGAVLLLLGCCSAGLYIAGSHAARKFEPRIRALAIDYLQKRFDSEVEIASLSIQIPRLSPIRLLLSGGRGTLARVDGLNLELRHHGRKDVPPLFTLRHFAFDIDIGVLADAQKTVRSVYLDGLTIHIPPKGSRQSFDTTKDAASKQTSILVEEVITTGATLIILPQDAAKVPLQFDIHKLRLESVGKAVAMRYEASLTNAKPPGQIVSSGSFGPWSAEEPGDTPLAGDYVFKNADLGVFPAIAGILQSTGRFEGSLSSISAKGEASVPDFRLKEAGNAVPLVTSFEVLVDGMSGDTVLKPVNATLGTTHFLTSGAVIKHEGSHRRTITLDVNMPAGNLQDLLRLAMKGEPFMQGLIRLKTKIGVPPLSVKVKDKLLLDGTFNVRNGKFLRTRIQDKVDEFSRRGQGQPKNQEIDEVFSRMAGDFRLADQTLGFRRLSFSIPGADIALTGDYGLANGSLDFRGVLRLRARMSQTMTGWKRWILKPVDPIFAKDGAGTVLRIKVGGTARDPKFGLDRGKPTQSTTVAK